MNKVSITKKLLLFITVIVIGMNFLTGCNSSLSRSKNDVNDINNAANNKIAETDKESSNETLDIIDKLPQEQKNAELDSALAAIRKKNKSGTTKSPDGTIISFTQNGGTLAGQSKNIPDWSKESEQSSLQRSTVIIDYLENTLKLTKKEYGYNSWTCLDPRLNAIYDDTDKGVAKGFDNKNIYIEEYETETEDIYSYLILVRDTTEGDWKVIHQGNTYK